MEKEVSKIGAQSTNESPLKALSFIEIQELVSARLETEESIESIMVDFKDQGVDINGLFNLEGEKKNIYSII